MDRFESVVEARGGDTMTNAPDSREPDNPAFVLPERRARESAGDYTRRILRAAAGTNHSSSEATPNVLAATSPLSDRETRPPPLPAASRRCTPCQNAMSSRSPWLRQKGLAQPARAAPGRPNSSGKTSCSPTWNQGSAANSSS